MKRMSFIKIIKGLCSCGNKRIALILITLSLFGCSSTGIGYYLPSNSKRAYTGLENFINNYAEEYKGKSAIVITNHSGVDYYLNQNITLFREKGINIFMIMAPEHGLYGFQNDYDTNMYTVDSSMNAIVYNLHMLNNKSLRFLFKKADIVIFDIQDMGMRCYTYISNLKFVMNALSGTKKELIVLDRPNPISFLGIDGAYLNKKFSSKYISSFPSPFVYNMTIGESALYYRGEFAKKTKLRVIKMKNYYKDRLYNETTLPWVPPSPNLPTYYSSIVYCAVVLMEGINISLGRGTTKPFEYIGAPWIEPVSFCKGLKKIELENFKFRPVYFKPESSKHQGQRCGGAQVFYTGGKFSPSEVSFKIIQYIMKNYRNAQWTRFNNYYDIDYLAGTDKFRKSIRGGKSFSKFKNEIKGDIIKYTKKRNKYLIYTNYPKMYP